MTSRLSKIILAAALAGSIPAAASARDCDHDDRRADAAYPVPAPPPVPAFSPQPIFVRDGRERGLREHAWRVRERIRSELAALDAERADFHARYAWRPWELRRYDRRYRERRRELERRLEELGPLAWR